MREIEIKLRSPNIEEVIAKLEKLGCIISIPKTQKDINFVHVDDVRWFESNGGDWVYPRLRIQDGKLLIFTVKKPVQNEMDCLEYEISIDSEMDLRGMMKLFGYKEGVTVVKTRKTCIYNAYTITLDDVVGLGSFVEIERVLTDGDALKIQDEMFIFARDILGLKKDEKVMKGYDILMYHKNLGS